MMANGSNQKMLKSLIEATGGKINIRRGYRRCWSIPTVGILIFSLVVMKTNLLLGLGIAAAAFLNISIAPIVYEWMLKGFVNTEKGQLLSLKEDQSQILADIPTDQTQLRDRLDIQEGYRRFAILCALAVSAWNAFSAIIGPEWAIYSVCNVIFAWAHVFIGPSVAQWVAEGFVKKPGG